jgi:hypothetical protein
MVKRAHILLYSNRVLLHEVMSPGIIVCITPIFEALEHVVLNPSSFHDVFWKLCSLPCLNLRG